jgi:SAM-dependent methyltransferase
MTVEYPSDRQRWDRKYGAGDGPAHFQPNRLLVDHTYLLSKGHALDVACGFGGNALFLAGQGYRVDAVDVSGVALGQLQAEAARRGVTIDLVQADLSRWTVPASRYDLITVFCYFSRSLFPILAAALCPDGLLFQANRNHSILERRPGFNPAYLASMGELSKLALGAGLEILHSGDGLPEAPDLSFLIARQPGQDS